MAKKKVVKENEMMECDECKGSGIANCFNCDSVIDCENCHGIGEVEKEDED